MAQMQNPLNPHVTTVKSFFHLRVKRGLKSWTTIALEWIPFVGKMVLWMAVIAFAAFVLFGAYRTFIAPGASVPFAQSLPTTQTLLDMLPKFQSRIDKRDAELAEAREKISKQQELIAELRARDADCLTRGDIKEMNRW